MDERTFLKTHTTLDPKFIDDFMNQYENKKDESDIFLTVDTLSKWIKMPKEAITRSIRKRFVEGIDYTEERLVSKTGIYLKFLLTSDVFKDTCLRSQTSRGDQVRRFFIEIEKAFFRYKDYVIKGLQREREALLNNQKPHHRYPKRDTIYIFTVPDEVVVANQPLLRVGRTRDLNKRMQSHNSPLANDIKILPQIPVNDAVKVEACMKLFLKDVQYRRGKEVYDITEAKIKNILEHCEGASIEATSLIKLINESKRGGHLVYAVKSV